MQEGSLAPLGLSEEDRRELEGHMEIVRGKGRMARPPADLFIKVERLALHRFAARYDTFLEEDGAHLCKDVVTQAGWVRPPEPTCIGSDKRLIGAIGAMYGDSFRTDGPAGPAPGATAPA